MEDPDWFFQAVWDEQERMEGPQSPIYPGWCSTVPEEA